MDASHLYNPQDFQQRILELLPLNKSSIEDVQNFLEKNEWNGSDKDINIYKANSDDIASFVEQDETTSEFAERITSYLIIEVKIPFDWNTLDEYPRLKRLRLWINSYFVNSYYFIIFFFDDDALINMRITIGTRAI